MSITYCFKFNPRRYLVCEAAIFRQLAWAKNNTSNVARNQTQERSKVVVWIKTNGERNLSNAPLNVTERFL